MAAIDLAAYAWAWQNWWSGRWQNAVCTFLVGRGGAGARVRVNYGQNGWG